MDNSNKKKVLHLHTLPIISGSGINTFLTMKKIDKNKYISSLACAPGGPLEDKVKKEGFEFIPIYNFVSPVNLVKDIRSFIEVYTILKNYKIDIIHTHNSKAGFIGRIAGRLAGIKKIVHTVHGFAFHNAETKLKRLLFIMLEKIASYFCDDMIFISKPMLVWAKKYKLLNKSKHYLIYSGIEKEKFEININKNEKRRELNLSPDNFVVGQVSKLWEGKGHRIIIEAGRLLKNQIPGLKILFIGEGELEDELKNIVNKYNLNDIFVFTGFRDDIAEITSILNISLLISDFEGMGRVILEAMFCKVPVIATSVGGIVDLIDNNNTGILIPPHNYEKLAEQILFLYKNKPVREKLKENAYINITEKYTADKMVEMIEKIYDEFKM